MLLELAGLSGLVALALTWVRLRSVRLAVIILVVAVYSTAVALAILYYCGGNMNLVMTMLPPLIFVLSISTAVHLTNYYPRRVGGVLATRGSGSSLGTWLATVRLGLGHDGYWLDVTGGQ